MAPRRTLSMTRLDAIAPLPIAITIAALCVPGDGLSVASRGPAAWQGRAPAAARQRGPQGKCLVQLSVAAFPLLETRSASGLSLDYCREAHLLAAAQAAAVGPKMDIAAPEHVVVGTSAAGTGTRHRTRPARADAESEARAAGGAEVNEAHEPASSNVRMAWLREFELMEESDEGGTILVEARAVAGIGVADVVMVGEGSDDLLSTGNTRFHLPLIAAGAGAPQERGAEVDAAYVLSLKQEVDSLFAQQRVGIAWTRFLRCVERPLSRHRGCSVARDGWGGGRGL
jgi:hypothetical protein